MGSQWQLKGNAPKIYDKYIAPAVSSPWYPLLLQTSLPYLQNGSIADIGCGTGSFLFHLSEQKHISSETNLFGIDLNPEMLALAREKHSTAKNNITWVEADVKKLPFTDSFFYLIYCQQGIQYFDNKLASLKEIHRVMDPQGVFIATVWSTIENCVGYKCLADAVLKIAGNSAETSLYAPFSYSDPYALHSLAKQAGFESIAVSTIDNFVHFESIKEFVWHRICGSPLINDLPNSDAEDIINEVVLQLELSLKDYEDANGLHFPVKANLLIAKK
jgi:ubiquinone/menaquinone biosynthesis C-methylase UbiE